MMSLIIIWSLILIILFDIEVQIKNTTLIITKYLPLGLLATVIFFHTRRACDIISQSIKVNDISQPSQSSQSDTYVMRPPRSNYKDARENNTLPIRNDAYVMRPPRSNYEDARENSTLPIRNDAYVMRPPRSNYEDARENSTLPIRNDAYVMRPPRSNYEDAREDNTLPTRNATDENLPRRILLSRGRASLRRLLDSLN